MPFSNQISNILTLLLMAFAIACFQAHLTDQYTPDFAYQIAASIHPLNAKVFWWLGLDDEQLNLVLAGINMINVVALVPSSMRRLGFMVNFVFYEIGLISNVVLGERVLIHVALCSICAAGFLLRSAAT